MPLKDIPNHIQVTDRLATSGQPTEAQFTAIAQAGYEVIINLAMPTSDHAIAHEGAVVTALGMTYIHHPVKWESPQLEDARLFFQLMNTLQERKLWVHCALNMRVSCFVYLYRKHCLQLPEHVARESMQRIWTPSGIWQELIVQVEAGDWSAFATLSKD